MYRLTNSEYFNHLAKNFNDGLALMRTKNADYAGTNDPFRNFRAAELIGMRVEHGMLIRMQDKMSRLGTLLQNRQYTAAVKDESILDTVRDLMNYSNILLTWLQSEGGLGEGGADDNDSKQQITV